MTDKVVGNENEAPKEALDLNDLSSLDFGPNWADKKAKPHRPKKDAPENKTRKHTGGQPRDRRSAKRASSESVERKSDQRGSYSGNLKRLSKKSGPSTFNPTVKVDLYPQDEAFDALIKRLRSSARTYQLFDLAQLLLEKPERYIAVVSPKDLKSEEQAKLYYSVPGHLPFETQEEAISYVIEHHLDLFFEKEEIEIDAPKGSFLMVNRCAITGELLGPPNYHRYQEFLQQHYNTRINGMSFEQFSSKIESVKEQEQIDTWLESMKKGARYIVKESIGSNNESFETLDSARRFLLKNHKDKVFGSGESIRFAGRDIERLPQGNIRRSVEAYVEKQQHFPLDSANNIRGRLRRQKFAVYKKGTKGISFVCAVKRKFRNTSTVFTDSINALINFIEKHPYLPASKLPKQYISVDTEKQKPEKLKMTEAEVEAVAKAKAESQDNTNTENPSNVENPKVVQNFKADIQLETKNVQASTEAMPKNDISEEDEAKLRQLMLDLRWLITEGYVTEYGDGRLFAPPPMTIARPNEQKKKEFDKDEVSKSQTTFQCDAQPEIINSELNKTTIIDNTNNDVTNTMTNEVDDKAETDTDTFTVENVPVNREE
ncbi:MAG: hypothetical protein VXZ83_00250 [Verrucomicrobiota bacterium]|nr:hypothetical protein [Verrucomicrobiota bacterium]